VKLRDKLFDENFFVISKTPETASSRLNNENVKLRLENCLHSDLFFLSVDGRKSLTRKDKTMI